ncbi:MAG: PAS domain S-box protein [Sandaracinus sp.]
MATWTSVGDSRSTVEADSVLGPLSSLAARFISDATASIAIFDRELRYIATSRLWLREFGGGRTDLTGLRHYDVVPEIPDAWREVHRRALAGEALNAEADEFVRADGKRMWLRWACHPWRTDTGEIGGLIMSSEDVTEAVEARRALSESEGRYRRLFELTPDAVLLNQDHRVAFANPAACVLFGVHSAEDLVGRSVWDIVHPASHDAIRLRIAALERGESVSHRYPIRTMRFDGAAPRDVEVSAVATSYRGRGAFQVVMHDVTNERRAAAERLEREQALRASEERFRQIAESIREVFWMTDIAKNEILYASPAYETIFGRSLAELYQHPRSWLDAIHVEDRARVLDALPAQAAGRYDLEYRVIRPDGSVRWIHDRAFPVRAPDGTVVRVAGVAEDITGRRTLEDSLRQAQRMESLGRLAGGIAHDFNNLLTVAITAAELVREEPAVSEDGRELLGSMLEVGRRGTSLTRQLLAFSREELVEPRVMELGEMVTETQKLLVRVIGEDVRVRTRLDPAHTPVRIDPGQWTQVLLNLAINARDAMPQGGELEIATGRAELDAREAAQRGLSPGTHAFLRVRDSGTGMTEEVRSRIFDPFFTTKPRGKGTGLGLAVVYGVVHQANGAIDVTSQVGIGTMFTIYVPMTGEPAVAEKPGSADVDPCGHETILVVEDEEALRRIVCHVLERGGYRVVQADGPLEALELLDRDPASVDLLLTDVVMPELDGVGLATRARAKRPDLPVLYTTGYFDDSQAEAVGKAIESSQVLRKPFSPQQLLVRVREALDG